MTTVEADVVDLPEFRDNPFIAKLPPLMPAIDILRALADPPIYQETERAYPAHLRAECVHRLGRYFEPLERHLQLASKFATLLRQGYISRNPLGADFIHRLQDGHERVTRRELNVPAQRVRSTASSFALVGCSGIGKSKSVERVLELYPQTIHHSEPFSLDQVVWLKLDCPFMGSPKQLCISFFKEMDKRLSAHIEFRGVTLGKQYLVLEIEKLFGRSLPCDRLTYARPGAAPGASLLHTIDAASSDSWHGPPGPAGGGGGDSRSAAAAATARAAVPGSQYRRGAGSDTGSSTDPPPTQGTPAARSRRDRHGREQRQTAKRRALPFF